MELFIRHELQLRELQRRKLLGPKRDGPVAELDAAAIPAKRQRLQHSCQGSNGPGVSRSSTFHISGRAAPTSSIHPGYPANNLYNVASARPHADGAGDLIGSCVMALGSTAEADAEEAHVQVRG